MKLYVSVVSYDIDFGGLIKFISDRYFTASRSRSLLRTLPAV